MFKENLTVFRSFEILTLDKAIISPFFRWPIRGSGAIIGLTLLLSFDLDIGDSCNRHNFVSLLFLSCITMATFSRGIRAFGPRGEFICSRCLQFSTTSAAQSGHSRWSKIKHDKGSADKKISLQRSILSKEIAFASKRKHQSMRIDSLKY